MIERRCTLPVLSGDSSRWVCVDANAVIDYIRECTLHDLAKQPTSRRAEALRIRLGQMGRVFVAETAGMEAEKNLLKDLAQKLGHADAATVKDTAMQLLYQYLDDVGVADDFAHVSAARKMYATISGDPANQKSSKWKRKKGAFIVDPVLGSDENDLIILSTAARHARHHAVELWTHDMDFTMFAGEIRETFGVTVVDTYRLSGHSLPTKYG